MAQEVFLLWNIFFELKYYKCSVRFESLKVLRVNTLNNGKSCIRNYLKTLLQNSHQKWQRRWTKNNSSRYVLQYVCAEIFSKIISHWVPGKYNSRALLCCYVPCMLCCICFFIILIKILKIEKFKKKIPLSWSSIICMQRDTPSPVKFLQILMWNETIIWCIISKKCWI